MKIILLKNVVKLGLAGEIKEVSEGYGRNYLLPNNLAKETDRAEINKVQVKLANLKINESKQNSEIEKIIKQLNTKSLVLKKQANEHGHLFAQVKKEEILTELSKMNISPQIKNIVMPIIKATGDFWCQIFFLGGKDTKFKITIKPLN
jgi:large subunit ribosomal protein L9